MRLFMIWLVAVWVIAIPSTQSQVTTINKKAPGFSGIWYQNQALDNEYRFKYSGGLGTYCAKHQPFAVYSPEADKTFFCFGGVSEGFHERFPLAQKNLDHQDLADALLHMVSYYDHRSGMVARPTVLLDKRTTDAHDNPVLNMDEHGYLWIFSTSHGTNRPSYLHRSAAPYSIDSFVRVDPYYKDGGKNISIDNFSYFQAWHSPGVGWQCFFTRYGAPAKRTNYFMTSQDGIEWTPPRQLAAIEEGHYQISGVEGNKAMCAFNYHPQGKGLNWRTNLYFMYTTDQGQTWMSAGGDTLHVPLTEPSNTALVHDFERDGLLVYLKDITIDMYGNPMVLFLTSQGHESGPANDPRTWMIAHWNGTAWVLREIMNSDNNYDMGSLYIDQTTWTIIAPSGKGPQPYNPGGEVVSWSSSDAGMTWEQTKSLTAHSTFNHTYVRRPVRAHRDFMAFWADGHGRQPSKSRLYFAKADGSVYQLPEKMQSDLEKPILITK